MQTQKELSLSLVDLLTILYLVWRKAVERPNWSQAFGLELTQVGQQ